MATNKTLEERVNAIEGDIREIRAQLHGIRAELEATNKRIDRLSEQLDATNERLDRTNERLDRTNERLDRTIESLEELRQETRQGFAMMASEIAEVTRAVLQVRDVLIERLDVRDQVDDHERRIQRLEQKAG